MATGYFQSALETDADCRSAQINLQTIGEPKRSTPASAANGENGEVRTRIAVLSLLFNWPSTGGGIIHTVELVRFLRKAGYDVRHLYAVFSGWEMGRVTEELPGDHRPLIFDEASWNADGIRRRFREALDEYRPDWVVITDSWNSKPLLAESAQGYRYVLRLAAQELLCPLNNVRLLMDVQGNSAPAHAINWRLRRYVGLVCRRTHAVPVDCIGRSGHSWALAGLTMTSHCVARLAKRRRCWW